MAKQHNQNNIGGQNQYSSSSKGMDFSTKSDKIGASMHSDSKIESSQDLGKSEDRSTDKSFSKQSDKTVGAGVGAAKADVGSPSSDVGASKGKDRELGEREEGGLPQIFAQVQDSKEAMKYVRQVEAYAEKNPMQTILATTVVGAFVGWLLTSTKGKSALKSSYSFAQPLVSNWMSENMGGRQGQSASTTKH